MHTEFLSENLTGKDHLVNLGVDETKILKWFFGEIGCEGVDRIHLDQDKDQRRAIANTAKNRRIQKEAENFLISWATIRF